jgi:hypothetical protein
MKPPLWAVGGRRYIVVGDEGSAIDVPRELQRANAEAAFRVAEIADVGLAVRVQIVGAGTALGPWGTWVAASQDPQLVLRRLAP